MSGFVRVVALADSIEESWKSMKYVIFLYVKRVTTLTVTTNLGSCSHNRTNHFLRRDRKKDVSGGTENKMLGEGQRKRC